MLTELVVSFYGLNRPDMVMIVYRLFHFLLVQCGLGPMSEAVLVR